jgi:hypothetical protein
MTSHKFQSITESQWKSGTPRSRCAECSQDYGHPVHCESSWPLVVVIEDCYVPEWAREVVKLTEGRTIEQDYGTIHALAVYAELGLRGNRLN